MTGEEKQHTAISKSDISKVLLAELTLFTLKKKTESDQEHKRGSYQTS